MRYMFSTYIYTHTHIHIYIHTYRAHICRSNRRRKEVFCLGFVIWVQGLGFGVWGLGFRSWLSACCSAGSWDSAPNCFCLLSLSFSLSPISLSLSLSLSLTHTQVFAEPFHWNLWAGTLPLCVLHICALYVCIYI